MAKTARDFEHQLKAIKSRIKTENTKRPKWPGRQEKQTQRLKELNQRLQDTTDEYQKFQETEQATA